ncbi:MAG: helix-turn-helix transcriptional regulator [Bacilli bacterium]|nr:helix-turn-helix transcriptional regulator [Bacilli bacterium]
MAIGNRIYTLRKEQKLSQEKLAEKIGVTRQTISNWELNESSPDLKQAKELSNVFCISLDELVENDIKDILLDKTNKSNNNMHKLNRIMLGVLLSLMSFLIVTVFIFLDINKSAKKVSDRHLEYRGIMAICELNDETVFISTPSSDYEKIKSLYESQGGKCYDRDLKEEDNKN